MNNAIFAAAHYLTRETRQAGDDYSVTFGAALKTAYASIDVATQKAERRVKITKTTKPASQFFAVCMIDAMDEIIDAVAEAAEQARKAEIAKAATTRATRTGGRYVELARVARDNNLNHGKTWWCGEVDIETKGAMPEWEGDLICYVYA